MPKKGSSYITDNITGNCPFDRPDEFFQILDANEK